MIAQLRYKMLRLECFLRLNFGVDRQGWHFWIFHMHRKPARRIADVAHYYETDLVWKVGTFGYFVIQ